MNTYPNLFSPITIGSMRAKNRIFMSPVGTHLASENYEVTEDQLAYYEERAKGGPGMITTECIVIGPDMRYSTFHNLGLFEDRMIPQLQKLTDVVHKHDVRICAQLMHPSSVATPQYNHGHQPVAASPLECRAVGEYARAATAEELKTITQQFGDAALRALKAGFDAVELHCCHGHGLLGRFLSPLENKRVDAYGGNVDGRLKLALDVIADVRSKVGPDFPIIVRMSCTDALEGGQSLMEGIHIAQRFQQAGVSMLHLSNGTMNTPWKLTSPAGTAKAFNAELAAQIKKAVTIPIGFIGRMNEPWAAELALQMGAADVTYMGRSMLCDPEFPCKAAESREQEIRPCIGCNHCLVSINADRRICCSMNPEVGRERIVAVGRCAVNTQRVLVIGGGPAGLTAAAYAAEAGHQVTLAERSDHLGGQMYLAGFPPCKQDLAAGTRYLIERCERAGVDIRLNYQVDPTDVADSYDTVLLATGGTPTIPAFLKQAGHLVTAWDVLEGKERAGKNVVIVGGGQVACETADFLLAPVNDLKESSRKVTLLARSGIAKNERSSFRPLMVQRLLQKGCSIITPAQDISAEGDRVHCIRNGEDLTLDHIDTVICAVGVQPVNHLESALREAGASVTVIGDAVKPGSIAAATASALEAVLKLNGAHPVD